MPSGMRNMVINTRERAVSTDINRLQAFLASEVGQIFYEMCGKYATSDDRNPGTEAAPTTGATPPFNVVLNGLRFYPLNGTLNGLLTPGVLLVDNTAAGTDDADFLYCNDPGVVAVGTLALTPAPGATRIDVIECQPVTTVVETDNRDIYNIATGLFAPAMVTKVSATRLTYRIRLGVAGGGYPGAAAGWIPLAVVRVPAAAASWDDCDIWDVRNLASEFWNAPYNSPVTDAEIDEVYLSAVETAAPAPYNVQLTGKVSGRFKHFRIGGSMLCNYPSAAAYVDISTGTTNWEAGLAIAASAVWYVYLAFPFGLPGWRKYWSSAVSPRVPTGLRGIPIINSFTKPPTPSRIPTAPLALPTVLGFGSTTSDAVCIFASTSNAANRMRGAAADGERIVIKEALTVAPSVSDPLGAGTTTYVIADSAEIPSCAKTLIAELGLALSKGGAPGIALAVEVMPVLRMYDVSGTFIVYEMSLAKQCTFILAAGVTAAWTINVEIPLLYRAAASGHTFDIVWNIQPDGAPFTGVVVDQLVVRGWRMD